jgi:hypothetical protein
MLAMATPDDIIVVTAQIERIRMTLGRDEQGWPACQIDTSTGDDRLDEVMCRESVKCVKAKPLPLDAMQACLNKRRNVVIERWARGRRT